MVDRLLDNARAGPFFLRQAALAELVVDAIHYNERVLGHYTLHAFVVRLQAGGLPYKIKGARRNSAGPRSEGDSITATIPFVKSVLIAKQAFRMRARPVWCGYWLPWVVAPFLIS